jgi:hypothetical protein
MQNLGASRVNPASYVPTKYFELAEGQRRADCSRKERIHVQIPTFASVRADRMVGMLLMACLSENLSVGSILRMFEGSAHFCRHR